MEKSQYDYWNAHLTVCAGPDWDEQVMVRNADGVGRPATSSELREAAQYLDWVRPFVQDTAT
jgi:hypothetical protein